MPWHGEGASGIAGRAGEATGAVLTDSRSEITSALKREAGRLGFDLIGACPAVTPRGISRFHQWLASGYAGEMRYLESRAGAYSHPRHVLDGARSLLMLGMNYRTVEPQAPSAGQGRVSRYAWGHDYHDLIHDRLRQLADSLLRLAPGARTRGIVDTAPLLEKEFAELAGLGWIGKNTLLLNQELGSWFFLAVLLTDLDLEYDPPQPQDHCGACRACLDACPTGAFIEPHVLDSRRCISYLTIELRGPIPRDLRAGIGDWLLGCDICQHVCPWNHRPSVGNEPAFAPRTGATVLELGELFQLDDAAFRARFRHTPFWRPKRRGVLRNAAIVLGNQRKPEAVPALVRGLGDIEPIVRGACGWALGRIGGEAALDALVARLQQEHDADVRCEIDAAMAECEAAGAQGK
ncbi:MAG: tRNA epoxyqueuosine(34) reductase QueG [Planctomycetes bacterium]|nr:tRNA epoxyqueuosine(34) reductase QueG [Planctomycetota bacterium]